MSHLRLLLPFLLLTLAGCSASPTEEADYVASVDAWHAQRVARLTQPDGWLSLVGLLPLPEGEHRFGSDPSLELVFPAPAPSLGGELQVNAAEIWLRAADGVDLRIDGASVQEALLQSDEGGEPTVVQMGRFRFHVIDRFGRRYVRLKDLESPARKEFTAIERWPVDPAWRVEARLVPYDPPKTLATPNVLGDVDEQPCELGLEFEIEGRTFRLDPLLTGDGGFFLVFGDETNGAESYGGGRFLSAAAPDESGRVLLDFNRATNPPCAFTPYATCPLPARQNVLPVAIPAGEKAYGDPH